MSTPPNPTVNKYGQPQEAVSYQPAGPANSITFAFQNILPPSALYITRDDVLVLQAASSAVNEEITVNVRLLLPDGRIQDMQFEIFPPNTRVVTIASFPLAEGFLLSLSATCDNATTRGATFLRAFLNRGAYGTGLPGQTLVADYVTQFIGAGYPGGRILAPVEGPGRIYQLNSTLPGAGADWLFVVPSNVRWRIVSIEAQLTTAVAVANRSTNISLAMGGAAPSFKGEPDSVIPASTVAVVSYSPAPIIAALVNTVVNVPIPPDNRLIGGDQITSLTANLQAADQWTQAILTVEEWLDNV